MKIPVAVFLYLYVATMAPTQTQAEKKRLRIGALLSIFHDPHDISGSNINLESVKNLEAMLWVFRQLNEHNYIEDYELELVTEYTGSSPEIANLKIGELIYQDTNCKKSEPLTAIIGPETVDEAMLTSSFLSSIPKEHRIPQVLFSTTSSILKDKSEYNNLLRVIQSDDTQIKAMMKVLDEFKWNMVALVYENNLDRNNTRRLLKSEAEKHDICIAAEYPIDPFDNSNFSKIVHDISRQNINGIIFFGRNIHTKQFLEAIEQVFNNDKKSSFDSFPAIILSDASVTSDSVFENNDVVMTSGKGAIFMSPPVNHISVFQDHWFSIFENHFTMMNFSTSNPYLKMLYESLTNCTQPNCTDCIDTESDCRIQSFHRINMSTLYTPYAIHAAFVVAKALKLACTKTNHGNRNLTGIRELLFNVEMNYSEFIELGIELTGWEGKHVKFKDGDSTTNEYFVNNYRKCLKTGYDGEFCSEKIGHYVTDPTERLKLNTNIYRDYIRGNEVGWDNRRIAACPVGFVCEQCLPKDLPRSTIYIPGDFIVLAAMPIHNIGANPFNCASIRQSIGLELALTIQWVIQNINDNELYFGKRGKTIGMLLFDTCNDPLIIQEKVLDFYKKGMKVGNHDLTHKVLGFVGSIGSGPTLAIANAIEKLNAVHVGCCSASSVLGDNNLFPTFLRVSMPLNRAVELMMEIAQKLNANSIQVLYSEGAFGENGRDLTIKMSRKNRICVANNITVPERSMDDYQGILTQLQSNPKSRLVFVFLRSHVAPVIARSFNSNPKFTKGQFTFLTSDAWGNRHENIRHNQKLEGTISIAQKMKMKWDDMKSFLTKIQPKQHERENVFLLPYFEAVFNCYFPWSFNKTYPEMCTKTNHSFSYDTKLDAWMPYIAWAVQALIKGAYHAYEKLCNGKGVRLCEEYRLYPKKVRDIIQTVKLDVDFDDVEDVLFDSNGDGVVGYKIYIAKKSQSDILEYIEVGEKRFGHHLNLPKSLLTNGQTKFRLDDSEVCKCLDIPCQVIETTSAHVKTALYTVSTVLTLLILTNIIMIMRCIYHKKVQLPSSESQHYLDPFHTPSVGTLANNNETTTTTADFQ